MPAPQHRSFELFSDGYLTLGAAGLEGETAHEEPHTRTRLWGYSSGLALVAATLLLAGTAWSIGGPLPSVATAALQGKDTAGLNPAEEEAWAGRSEGTSLFDGHNDYTELREGLKNAQQLKQRASGLLNDAEDIEGQSEADASGANILVARAKEEIMSISSDFDEAEAMKEAGENEMAEVAKLEQKADQKMFLANYTKKHIKEKEQKADGLRQEADRYAEKAQGLLKEAEWAALAAVYKDRVCIDLPGVQLAGDKPLDISAGYVDVDLNSPHACRDWCRKHDVCKQAVFDRPAGQCSLFGVAEQRPLDFKETFNSSYCGALEDKKVLMGMLHKAFGYKPWIPEPTQCSWAGENCAKTKCCANACKPAGSLGKFNYKACEWYTCWQKSATVAECRTGGSPATWLKKRLGGHPQTQVKKGSDDAITQGTTLFCFSVVVWSAPAVTPGGDGEGVIATAVREKKASVMKCDGHAWYEGVPASSHIDPFMDVWQKVKDDARWKNYDWTVKVDVDTVFFPERLKLHLNTLRTPKGSFVYLRNTEFAPHFVGALVVSNAAMGHFFKNNQACEAHVDKDFDDNYWLQACLEGIGVDFQVDESLLADAAMKPGDGCSSALAAMFRPYDSVDAWNACHDTSQATWDREHP